MNTSKTIFALALMLTMVVTPLALAEEPFASKQDASEARDFLGAWAVVADMNGREMNFALKLLDLDGKVGGTIDSAQMPEPRALDSIEMDERGNIIIGFELSFGSQSFTMSILASLAAEGLEGSINEQSGLFNIEFTAKEAVDDPETSQQRRRNRRSAANMARARFGDETVRITFSPLKSESEDFGRLDDVATGEVFEYVGGRATKLFTDLDLNFGGATVETENAAANYPGVYSLWLKKTDDGWNLVANEEADVWGTMHNPETDAAEFALTMGTLDEAAETFKVEIKNEDGTGKIRILWGDREWTADFQTGRRMGTTETAAAN